VGSVESDPGYESDPANNALRSLIAGLNGGDAGAAATLGLQDVVVTTSDNNEVTMKLFSPIRVSNFF
jgi:hypothetical protein